MIDSVHLWLLKQQQKCFCFDIMMSNKQYNMHDGCTKKPLRIISCVNAITRLSSYLLSFENPTECLTDKMCYYLHSSELLAYDSGRTTRIFLHRTCIWCIFIYILTIIITISVVHMAKKRRVSKIYSMSCAGYQLREAPAIYHSLLP